MLKATAFVVSSLLASLAFADFQDRVTTTYTCSEIQGSGKWSVSVIEDTKSKDFWAGVKYEATEIACDDVSNGAQTGLSCNYTGGKVVIASPNVHFKTCNTSGRASMLCKNEQGPNPSYISLNPGDLGFMLELDGDDSALITKLLESVTVSVLGKPRVTGVSDCEKTVTKAQK